MALKLITAAAVDPLDLAEVKAHLRVDHVDDDALITIYQRAAVAAIEGKDGWLGRALITQTWDLYLDSFPAGEIKIPLAPLQSVTHVKYDDAAGVEQTVAAADYTVDAISEPGWVVPNDGVAWPTTLVAVNAVRVRFVAGYGVASASVPAAIRAAILLTVGTLYGAREDVVLGQTAAELPGAAQHLLSTFRVYG